jgi:hypothetical protein
LVNTLLQRITKHIATTDGDGSAAAADGGDGDGGSNNGHFIDLVG